MNYVLVLLVLFSGLSAMARPTPDVLYRCQGKMFDESEVTFKVQQWVENGVIKGILNINAGQEYVSLTCGAPEDVGGADRTPVLVCVENRPGHGKVIVYLERGLSGKLIGQVQREQMLPLEPQSIGGLICPE